MVSIQARIRRRIGSAPQGQARIGVRIFSTRLAGAPEVLAGQTPYSIRFGR